MKKNKFFFLTIFVLSISILLSGCITVKTGTSTNSSSTVNGGIFRSINKGVLWQQKVLIPSTTGKPGNIASLDAASLAIDPSDNKAVYLGSVSQGLFYTYDSAESWKQVKSLGVGTVRTVAIDYNNKCTIYASIGNKLHKSIDCARTWAPVYLDNEGTVTIDALALDPYNSSIVYIGISRGDILKSSDAGTSWQTLYRIKDKIKKIVIDPNDTKVIFAATNNKGILRSTDSGETWVDTVNVSLKDLKIGTQINNIILLKDEPAGVYVATENGLAHSKDRGETWENITILPPQNKAKINDMAVNPKNTKEIYYVSDTTFFRSIDGGTNWSTIKMPTSRAGWLLLIDPKEPSVIYMGVKSLTK